MNKTQIQQELKQAVDGLLLQSEIESPFEFVYLEKPQDRPLKPEDVVEYAGKPAGMAVKVQELEEFMQQLQGVGSDARRTTPGDNGAYQQLMATLRNLLHDVKVYSITQIGTEAYILGKAEDGHYAGLRTMMIEGESTIEEPEE